MKRREARPEKPRGSQLVEGNDESVAREVQELWELLRRGEGASEWQGASPEVRRVASGLQVIWSSLQRSYGQLQRDLSGRDLDRLLADFSNAAAIFDALITGRDHPIWTFINGIQKGSRNAKAPPNLFDLKKRAAILAYLDLLKTSGQRDHVKFGVDQLRASGISMTKGTVQGWRYRSENGDDLQALTSTFISDFFEMADVLDKNPEDHALERVQTIWRGIEYPRGYLKS